MQITNCHSHTFTHEHVPDRFVARPLGLLLRVAWIRRALLFLMRQFGPKRRGKLTRYAQILHISYEYGDQEGVFKLLRSYYPEGTRFVVLPMDMEYMNAGSISEPIEVQHRKLAELRDKFPELVIPFAAADPRRSDVVTTTKQLLEEQRFAGIKLYPPIGYHPNDPALGPLYDYAAERGVPVLTHCSRPSTVQYRGQPTEQMRLDPISGARREDGRYELLKRFTDPDAYVPILDRRPRLKLCLAHWGGAGDWEAFLDHPWDARNPSSEKSWLAKVTEMISSGKYENLYTDIAYTIWAKDEYVYLLKVLLSDERLRRRVLFGSDFYVVESAEFEERRRSVRVRAVLGEELFQTIAYENPRTFLGEA